MRTISFANHAARPFTFALALLLSGALASCATGVPAASQAATPSAKAPASSAPVPSAVPSANSSAPASTPGSPGSALRTVTFNYQSATACWMPEWVALDKGYFRAEGLNVIAHPYSGSSATQIPLVATGKVDISDVVPAAGLYNAASQNFHFKLLAAIDWPHPGYASSGWFVVRDQLWKAGANSVTTLPKSGLKVFNLGFDASPLDLMNRGVLLKAGFKGTYPHLQGVQWVSETGAFPPSAVASLFKAGGADAGAYVPPPVDAMAAQGLVHKMASYADVIPWYQDCFIASSTTYASAHASTVAHFIQALLRADQLIASAKGKYTPYLLGVAAKTTGLPRPMIKAGLVPYVQNYGQINRKGLDQTQKVAIQEGLVKHPLQNMDALIDVKPLAAARKALHISGPAAV